MKTDSYNGTTQCPGRDSKPPSFGASRAHSRAAETGNLARPLTDAQEAPGSGFWGRSGRRWPGRNEPVIYFVRSACGLHKVGTTRNLAARLKGLMATSPVALELLAWAPGDVILEKAIHRALELDRSHSEWFRPSPELRFLVESAADRSCDFAEAASRVTRYTDIHIIPGSPAAWHHGIQGPSPKPHEEWNWGVKP